MDWIRERTAGWPTPAFAQVPVPEVPVALEAASSGQSVVAGGGDTPWRTGDWFHSQVSSLLPAQAPAAIVRDGLAPIGSLPPAPPETGGQWFSQQLTAIATMEPGSAAAPYLGPEMRPDYANLATAQAPPGHVIVQIGDSLPKIARRLLGDESRWVEIFELNRDQILNQDVILPGMVLRLPQGPKPAVPPRPPAPQPQPPIPATPAEPSGDAEALRRVTPEQLAYLGATDKARFFAVLKPAAVAAERTYGVPWQITLAQVALESGWGKHGIGGYNVFGIKGSGPAGSVVKSTKEWRGGRYVTENARFAKYNDYYEAIMEHGKLFHNGYYNKAVNQFARDRDPIAFAQNIHGIYATSPTYAQNLITIMRQYNLV